MISQDLKTNLDDLLDEVNFYVRDTYGQHYAEGDFQMIDVWERNGSLVTTARDIAMKHLDRYGRKEGYNRKDLLKAIHFILMMMQDADKGHAEPGITERVDTPSEAATRAMETPVSKATADAIPTFFTTYDNAKNDPRRF